MGHTIANSIPRNDKARRISTIFLFAVAALTVHHAFATGERLSLAPVNFHGCTYTYWAMKESEPKFYDDFIASIKHEPPDVAAYLGFSLPFSWKTGTAGPVEGKPGEKPQSTPDEVQARIDKIRAWVREMHATSRVKLMPYMDAGTQLLGNHVTRTGMWEFYDHWDDYAKRFQLGPKPSEPYTWLRRLADPQAKWNPSLPDEMKGLSFLFGPIKPATYGPFRRYVICVNSDGWRSWESMTIEWAARVGFDGVFMDNPVAGRCWCDRCQKKFQEFMAARHDREELRAVFGVASPTDLRLGQGGKSLSDPLNDETSAFWRESAREGMAYLKERARKINPNFEIMFNNTVMPGVGDYLYVEGTFGMHGLGGRKDLAHSAGLYLPGGKIGWAEPYTEVKDPIVCDNIVTLKYRHAARTENCITVPDVMMSPDQYRANADSQFLAMAEVAAFGGGAGVESPRYYYAYYIYSPEEKKAIQDSTNKAFDFFRSHNDLYAGFLTCAEVGLVMTMDGRGRGDAGDASEVMQQLDREAVPYQVLTGEGLVPENLSRLRVLIATDTSLMSDQESRAVKEFIAHGGIVLAKGNVAEADLLWRARKKVEPFAWPPVGYASSTESRLEAQIGKGRLIYFPKAEAATIAATITEVLGRTASLLPEMPMAEKSFLRVNAWQTPRGRPRNVVLHLLNYKVPLGKENDGKVEPLSNLEVRFPMPQDELAVDSVTLYPVDGDGRPQKLRFTKADGFIRFIVPSLRIYDVLVLAERGAGPKESVAGRRKSGL